MALRLIFMGTPAFSVPCLRAVRDAGHRIAAVYSQPPRPAGRGMAEAKSPVHLEAQALGIPVMTPQNFKDQAARDEFKSFGADAAVVVAYGLLLPEAVLSAPKYGCFNVHASKLPRWRGAAPIQRAIMAGDKSTAVNIMQMEKGLDTGPVCLSHGIEIPPGMTAGELHDALASLGARAICEALSALEARQLKCVPQPETGVTYAAKITKAEARIDFSMAADRVVDHIRALAPAPGAWCETGGERIKVLAAVAVPGAGEPGVALDSALTIACGAGAVRLETIQRAGKKSVLAAEFLRGFAVKPGTRFA